MEETKKAVEVKDEELDQVTGGVLKKMGAKSTTIEDGKLTDKKKVNKNGIGLDKGGKTDVCSIF